MKPLQSELQKFPQGDPVVPWLSCPQLSLIFFSLLKIFRRYVELISATDFNGVSGRINFKSGPSRSSVIQVNQWLNGKTYNVGTFFPNSSAPGGGGR